jgi:CPA1 family monovalent cation:H+ antiporter
MNETLYTITVFIALLLVASGVAMATKWVRVPYTLALIIVGLVISPMHFLPIVHVSPELILLIFLPALLFEAAWNLKLDHLRENWLPILTLAVVGVAVSVGVVGAVLHFGIGLGWSSALLFGAMISATDPVSVLALFKRLGAPKRLTAIVENESLFNDGTAVVFFRIILGIVIGTTAGSAGDLALHSLREFCLVVFGGVAIGATIGILASVLTSYFDDHLLEITLTTIVAYGSFLIAESLHVSPVIAVLAAGLIIGNYGRQRGMSPTTQVAVNSFWESGDAGGESGQHLWSDPAGQSFQRASLPAVAAHSVLGRIARIALDRPGLEPAGHGARAFRTGGHGLRHGDLQFIGPGLDDLVAPQKSETDQARSRSQGV